MGSVRNHFRTEPFELECELVSQMQHAALQINDHQVIRRRMSQSVGDLLFDGFVPPFKTSNVIRFRHVLFLFESPTEFWTKKSGRAKGR